MLPAAEEPGTYEYTWKAKGRGSYHIWLQMAGRENEKPGLRKFEVQLPAREKEDLRIDEKTLAGLATSQGRFFPPAEMDQAGLLRGRESPDGIEVLLPMVP